MTLDELVAACKARPEVTLVVAGTSPPFYGKGWPRAELLCQNRTEAGPTSVWLYNSTRLLAALEKQTGKLADMQKSGMPRK